MNNIFSVEYNAFYVLRNAFWVDDGSVCYSCIAKHVAARYNCDDDPHSQLDAQARYLF
uniref:Uncharacterized protein n=1 Tax=Methylophaga nitratireducenticrescens TaxID=754476 RepID=I1XFA6_METNJ